MKTQEAKKPLDLMRLYSILRKDLMEKPQMTPDDAKAQAERITAVFQAAEAVN